MKNFVNNTINQCNQSKDCKKVLNQYCVNGKCMCIKPNEGIKSNGNCGRCDAGEVINNDGLCEKCKTGEGINDKGLCEKCPSEKYIDDKGYLKLIPRGYYKDKDNYTIICNGTIKNGNCTPDDPNAMQCTGIGYDSSCRDKNDKTTDISCSRGLCFCGGFTGIVNKECKFCREGQGEGISINSGTCIKCPSNYKIDHANKTCVPK